MTSFGIRASCWLFLLCFITLSGCSNLSVAIGPRATQADLRKLKKVALQLNTGSNAAGMDMFGGFRPIGSSSSQDTFADHFAVELLKLGIDVVERTQLDKVMREQALNMGGVTDTTDKTIAAGKILALDALIMGSVSMNQEYSTGFIFGIGGGFREVVNSASIKFIDVEKGNVLLIITLSGGRDQLRETAESFAKAFKEKLQAQ